MKKRNLVLILAVIVVGVAWYAFRPERLFVNQTVNESFPSAKASANTPAAPMTLVTGQFHGVAHDGKGVATVYQTSDGKQVLRLTEFQTSNGPELHLYLVAAAGASDNDTVKNAGFLDLGSLKGNQGDQNYDVPAGTDLSKYRAVTVWCKRFGVNFATAPLAMGGQTSSEPKTVASGRFHGVAHESRGIATVYQVPGGMRVLRLTEFETSNGPELQLYLVAAADAGDSDTVKKAGFISLGTLKGNKGDQNYDVPATVDLAKYRAVTVWCKRFSVNFATAPLTPQGM